MRVRVLKGALLLAALILTAPQARAQEDDAPADTLQIVELRLVDGSRLIGSIDSETAGEIVFRTAGGAIVRIPADQVESRRDLTGQMWGGRYGSSDPNVSRLFFTATGRPVPNGTGYFSDYYIFFPFVAYGVGDVLTLAGGVSLIPGSSAQLLYLAPKLTVYHDGRASVSAGVLAGTVTNEDTWGGLMYGVGTFGSTDDAVTLGLGFAWGGGEVEDTPIILIGGETRVGRGLKLISENYIIPGVEDAVLLSGGLRFFGERLAADLAFITMPGALDGGGFPFLPFVGFAYNFGH